MKLPTARRIYRAIEATWPPYKAVEAGPWVLREGAGGGKRVSAATARGAWDADVDLPAAEDAMRILGQDPLFMIRDGDQALDAELAQRGYRIVDPVNIYACPVWHLTDVPLPPVCVFTIWEPLAIMREIWAEGGIGPERLAVMQRAQGPRTGLFGRTQDKPAGVGFAAADEEIAMVHALEILPAFRRKGLGQWMMRGAAHWAADWGIEYLSVICTRSNSGANALYSGLGMHRIGHYHYRIKPRREEGET